MSKTKFLLPIGQFNPRKLLDTVVEQKGLKTYTRLAELLGVDRTTLSNIKLRNLAPSHDLMIRIQEVSGLSMREMRDLMDDRRRKIRADELIEPDGK